MKKVIVVGGGPAGMSAAVAAAKNGHSVTLLEANEKLGKKLYITGKGRCNYSNASPVQDYFQSIVSNPKFMYSSLYVFSPEDFSSFLEEYGCPVKEERGRRLFPVSDHASDVTKAFTKALGSLGVKVMTSAKIKTLLTEGDACVGVVLSDGSEMRADHTIVATGGLSYPTTGSTGDGLRFARELGIKVSSLRPALVPLECEGSSCGNLQGLSLKNVSLTITKDTGKTIYKDFGEMIFTHFGISGPIVLSASSFAGKAIEEGGCNAVIDLKPAITREELDKRLLGMISEHPKKQFSHFYEGLLPSRLMGESVKLTGIDPEKRLSDITKEERKRILSLLKEFTLKIKGTRGFSEAIITQGGVAVKYINPKTMEVKGKSGLSFAGEVLDIDALTGGFNIQCAVSMGFLAGGSI